MPRQLFYGDVATRPYPIQQMSDEAQQAEQQRSVAAEGDISIPAPSGTVSQIPQSSHRWFGSTMRFPHRNWSRMPPAGFEPALPP